MTPWDLLGVLVLAGWWGFFRRRYDWRAVALFYFGGVMVADLFCAVLVFVASGRVRVILDAPAVIMPLGAIGFLVYAAATGKLDKGSRLFPAKDTTMHQTQSVHGTGTPESPSADQKTNG